MQKNYFFLITYSERFIFTIKKKKFFDIIISKVYDIINMFDDIGYNIFGEIFYIYL